MAPQDEDLTTGDDRADAQNTEQATEASRRDFLKTVGVSGLATTMAGTGVDALAQGRQQQAGPTGLAPLARAVADAPYMPIRREVADNLVKRGIVGYADHLRIQPGETIKFMVSSELPRYRADIVRLIHGDANPKGPGIKEVLVETSANREYAGRHQDLPLGSYATVPDNPALRISGSFTVTAWIAPTTQRLGAGQAMGAEGVVTKWADAERGGYGLFIDESGRLALWLSEPGGRVEKIHAEPPLRPWIPAIPGVNQRPQGVSTSWYFVAASFHAETGKVVLYQDPLSPFPFDHTRAVTERSTAVKSIGTNNVPLLIAACWQSSHVLGRYYNGKIDNPRSYGRALTAGEIESLERGRFDDEPIASWDFSRDIETDSIVDTSPRQLHGRTVNLPMRAVTGHNWNASEMDYTRARDQYGAIYFHDDDIDDARWDVGFELRVPENLQSGLYAARLRTAPHEDYVPFVIRPKRGAAPARIALLIPTFSYLAYGGTGTSAFRPLSLYSRHSDGSGVCYSSRLRPITNMRPKIETNNPWQFMADTHLVDWLEHKGFTVDFYTDEDLHVEGAALLAPYKAVLTATQPEYYSLQMLNGLRGYLENGGRLMYLGGNGFYWVTPMDPTGRYIEVRRRDGTEHWQGAPGEHYHSLTGEPGGLWRFRGMAPQQFVGVGFTAQGFDRNCPYKRMPDSFDARVAFIFEGIASNELIGNHPSLVLGFGAAGSELDRADFAIGTPPHTLVLASSFGHSDAYQHVVEQINTSNGAHPGGTDNPLVRADMVYLEYPKGGAVFSTSAIAWCGSLSFNSYDNNVSRITENVLRRFSSDVPLPPPTGTTPALKTGSDKR
ncbi:MAG: N,N-dimethylformamidase [Acidobacteria bacterium]|nr:MAG: N,N-dimethylformamidase [Acidobacteriota bacterium]